MWGGRISIYNLQHDKKKQNIWDNVFIYKINMPLSCNERFIHINLENYIKRCIWNIENTYLGQAYQKGLTLKVILKIKKIYLSNYLLTFFPTYLKILI
jgi:retron-type reverse transcriptase